ncbi:MAG: hypothetical protein M3R61_17850, partial [Chloroflexota bacterium]|nr:hypothetical protein [Chloroflexota bacterium]
NWAPSVIPPVPNGSLPSCISHYLFDISQATYSKNKKQECDCPPKTALRTTWLDKTEQCSNQAEHVASASNSCLPGWARSNAK